jgi:mannose-1-phosphate guanylyltransferase
MKAIILVGGEGTRLRPLTLDTPKPLLPIANTAFIYRQILWLKSFGVDNVVLSLCYLPDQFISYFDKNPIENVKIEYVVEDSPLGTGGAIKFAAGDIHDSVIVCNGDVLTQINLKDLIDLHTAKESLATIALTQVEDPSAFGVVPTDNDNKVIAFVEKPKKDNAPSNWINAGIYILSHDFLELIPDGLNVSIERETFPKAIQEGAMYALESQAYWLDIGTIEKYIDSNTDFLKSINEDSDQNKYEEIATNFYTNGEVTIGAGAIAKTKCLIGKGSIIEDDCILSDVVLGENVVVAKGAIITSSIIYDNVNIGLNVNIEDSVIGKNVLIGDNVVVSNNSAIGSNEKVEQDSHLIAVRISTSE